MILHSDRLGAGKKVPLKMLHYHEFGLESNSFLALSLTFLHIIKLRLYFVQILLKYLLSNVPKIEILPRVLKTSKTRETSRGLK